MTIEHNEINMPTKYEPSNVEAGKYKWWLEKEFFKAEGNTDKNLTVLLFHHQT